MTKKLCMAIVAALILAAMAGCGTPLADGTLSGTIVREGTGQPVPFPVIVIGRTLKSPLMPDQMGGGDKDGKFTITVTGGNYNIQIGTNQDGPLYNWPDVVFVEPDKTTSVTFVLPTGF